MEDHRAASPDETTVSDNVETLSREFVDDATEPTGTEVLTKRYDADRAKDYARAWLAGSFVILLAVVLLLVIIACVFCGYAVEDAKELLGITLGPLVGFVGSATGFYYGARKKDE